MELICGSHKFNNGFADLLYGNRQEMGKKILNKHSKVQQIKILVICF
jgi:hypothetical protein